MRWKANPEVVLQRLGDSMVLVNLATDRIVELNETAASLFELISDGLDESEIEARLAEEFDVNTEVLRSELPVVLRSLEQEQLVTVDA